MKRCPKCGAQSFFVSAHVVQDWVVDEHGDFLRCEDDCAEVIHYPDSEDIWTCANCGYSDEGNQFEEKKE